MTNKPIFDIQAAHKYFAAECFNHAWDYIDKQSRDMGEGDKMLQLSLASLWHWTERLDCTPTNLSISYWQVSRVFALLGQAENARHYGELCLNLSQTKQLESFYRGYAYEALARAEMVAGNEDKMAQYLVQAQQIAVILPDPTEQEQLQRDLETIHIG